MERLRNLGVDGGQDRELLKYLGLRKEESGY
jgi:hypothetical protein